MEMAEVSNRPTNRFWSISSSPLGAVTAMPPINPRLLQTLTFHA
jgi:hypothetical protein